MFLKIFTGSLLAISLFMGCEDSTSSNDTPEVTAEDFSTKDVCSLMMGAVCSTTPKGAVPTLECTDQGGTIETECPADELLKCEGLDVPDHEGVQSNAYIYSEAVMGILTGIKTQLELDNECEAVPFAMSTEG